MPKLFSSTYQPGRHRAKHPATTALKRRRRKFPPAVAAKIKRGRK
jgi:hypothetical protein